MGILRLIRAGVDEPWRRIFCFTFLDIAQNIVQRPSAPLRTELKPSYYLKIHQPGC